MGRPGEMDCDRCEQARIVLVAAGPALPLLHEFRSCSYSVYVYASSERCELGLSQRRQ